MYVSRPSITLKCGSWKSFFSADWRSLSSTPGRRKSLYSEASPFSVSTGGNSVFAVGGAAPGAAAAGGAAVAGAAGRGAVGSFPDSSLRRDQRERNGSLSVLTRRLSLRL